MKFAVVSVLRLPHVPPLRLVVKESFVGPPPPQLHGVVVVVVVVVVDVVVVLVVDVVVEVVVVVVVGHGYVIEPPASTRFFT